MKKQAGMLFGNATPFLKINLALGVGFAGLKMTHCHEF
jgi:hypothetical protein